VHQPGASATLCNHKRDTPIILVFIEHSIHRGLLEQVLQVETPTGIYSSVIWAYEYVHRVWLGTAGVVSLALPFPVAVLLTI